MLIVPTVTGIRTFIGRPSVPHFSISPATCQGQAADAVAALAHARNLRPLALEILCVPRFAHLQKILNTATAKLRMFSLQDGQKQLAVYQRKSNNIIMTCLKMRSPNEVVADGLALL